MPGIKARIDEAPSWKELSLVPLRDGAHGFDQAAQETITRFINPVRQTGRPLKPASLEDILHVVQQDLDQQKRKTANGPLNSSSNHYLIEDIVAVKAYQAYALLHGKDYIEKALKPALTRLQQGLNKPITADKDWPIEKIADIAQAVLDNLAHGKAGFDAPDALCMLLAGLAGLVYSPSQDATPTEAQYALLHTLFMVHLIPKHIAMRDKQQRSGSSEQALRNLIKILKSEAMASTCKKQLQLDHELKLNKKKPCCASGVLSSPVNPWPSAAGREIKDRGGG